MKPGLEEDLVRPRLLAQCLRIKWSLPTPMKKKHFQTCCSNGVFTGRETVYLPEHGNLSSHHTEKRTTGPQCWTAIYAHTRDMYVEKCPVLLYKTLGQNMRVSHSGMGWFLLCSPDCFNSEIPCKSLLLYLLIVCWAHKVLVSSAVVGKSLGLIKVLVRRDIHRRVMLHPTCILMQPPSLTHTQPDLSSFHRS